MNERFFDLIEDYEDLSREELWELVYRITERILKLREEEE